MNWLGRHELATLVLIVLLATMVWGFVALAGEVMEGDTRALDERILLALRTPGDLSDPLGPGWIEEVGRDFTALGGMGVLTLLTLVVAGYLIMMRRYGATLLMLVAIGGGLLASTLLKFGFDRPRPDLVPHGSIVYSASFPSGHSMLSAVTYLTLGALLARVQPRRRLKAYFLILAVLLTLMVGSSRIYLGVHWPTDVLAGWTAGAAWALLCWLIARWLQQRGAVEEDVEEEPEEMAQQRP
ncbi:MAG: phosphatase PAP2 family protein [Candidatus Competibacteraceae bacterium]|nr:phosphatase PAP2 family protein [Candidatus Competibacteraceae bacterium]